MYAVCGAGGGGGGQMLGVVEQPLRAAPARATPASRRGSDFKFDRLTALLGATGP